MQPISAGAPTSLFLISYSLFCILYFALITVGHNATYAHKPSINRHVSLSNFIWA